jgi:hypothetical protein
MFECLNLTQQQSLHLSRVLQMGWEVCVQMITFSEEPGRTRDRLWQTPHVMNKPS